jgi:Kelch motif protein
VVARLLAATVPAARYRTMGAALDESMYLLGGLDASGFSTSDIYRILPATGQVAMEGHLATPTHGAAAVAFGSRVLIFGGPTWHPTISSKPSIR